MKKWIPVDPYNVTALELWINEMEEKGWYLVKLGRFFATFDEVWPTKKPQANEMIQDEIERLQEEQEEVIINHSYVHSLLNIKKSEGIQIKWRISGLIALAVALIVIFWMMTEKSESLLFNDALLGATILVAFLLILAIVIRIKRYHYFKNYQEGKPTTEKPNRRTRAVVYGVILCLILAEIALCGLRLGNSWKGSAEEVPLFVVTPEMLKERGVILRSSDMVKSTSSLAVPVQYYFEFQREGNRGALETYMTMRLEYFEARSSGLAKYLLNSLMNSRLYDARGLENHDDYYEEKLSGITGVTEGYIANFENGRFYLFLRKDNRFLYLTCYGDESPQAQDVLDNIQKVIAMLEGE